MKSHQNPDKSITSYFKSAEAKAVTSAPPKTSKVKPCKKRSRELDTTPSLHKFFQSANSKRAHLEDRLHERANHQTMAMVGISYRNDGEGKGALFDHRTIQLATDTPTAIINAETIPRSLVRTIQESQNFLKYGIQLDATQFKYPPIKQPHDQSIGLLIIPGVSEQAFKAKDFKLRKEADLKMINQALLRGQPVLGICGGSWTLYEYFGGATRDVQGHNYRGGMPRLAPNSSVPSHNKPMHGLSLSEKSYLLRAAFGISSTSNVYITVNSVHPKAPDEKRIPASLQVSAIATHDEALIPKGCPHTEPSIEAFETIYGVPVLGIQWHPEAYATETVHSRMLTFMAKAGQRYKQHRQVLTELSENINTIKPNLKKQFKLHHTREVLRRNYKDNTLFFERNGKHHHDPRHLDELKWERRCKEDYLVEKVGSFTRK